MWQATLGTIMAASPCALLRLRRLACISSLFSVAILFFRLTYGPALSWASLVSLRHGT